MTPRQERQAVSDIITGYDFTEVSALGAQARIAGERQLAHVAINFCLPFDREGVDINSVSRLLGHSSVKVTERYYLALEQEHVHLAVNHLDFDDDV